MAASEEVLLAGGLGSAGLVVRVGDTVRRPLRPESAAVHDLLHHLERVGFAGAPRHLGTDDQGRAILTWVEGDVGIPPFPAWSAADDLAASVADLHRRYHEAVRSYVPLPDAEWARPNLPRAPSGVSLVGHNDLCVENVVVRDGVAIAFIDFDFAAPVDPLLDVAIMARHWVPLRDPTDLDPGWAGVDQVGRFHRIAAAHGLDRAGRGAVVAWAGDFLDRALVTMKARADEGRPGYVTVWEGGYEAQNRRSRAWVDAHAEALTG